MLNRLNAPPYPRPRKQRLNFDAITPSPINSDSPFRLKATLGTLPVVNPSPGPPPTNDGKVQLNSDLRIGIGWNLRPDYDGRFVARHPVDGVLYDIRITTDHAGRRQTPVLGRGPRRRHALVFGCSFVFGIGLNDDETLPSQIGRYAPDYRAYNYGIAGAGVNEILERVASRDLRKEVPEEEGVGIYLFIQDHLRRIPPSIGTLETRRNTPYYYEEKDGSIVRAPSFAKAFPLTALFYDVLAKSQTLKYFDLDYQMTDGLERIRLAARLTRKMADEYRRQFPKDEFYVVLSPEWVPVAYTRALDEVGVKYLDYSNVVLAKLTTKSPYVSSRDGHPSGEANRVLGRQIALDLGLVKR